MDQQNITQSMEAFPFVSAVSSAPVKNEPVSLGTRYVANLVKNLESKKPEKDFKEIICPKGSFEMGGPNHYDSQAPRHWIELKQSFVLADSMVSQSMWKNFASENPSNWIGLDLPVERVSWVEAILFCNFLSICEGYDTCYEIKGGNIHFDGSANGYRLPFEIEWEYAARAGTGFETQFSGSNELSEVSSTSAIGLSKDIRTRVLRSRKPNAWGIYDMTGNLNEWCNDLFDHESYHKRNKSSERCFSFDAKSASFSIPLADCRDFSDKKMVVRGGSWYNSHDFSKVYTRHFQNLLYPSSMVGIRLARTIF